MAGDEWPSGSNCSTSRSAWEPYQCRGKGITLGQATYWSQVAESASVSLEEHSSRRGCSRLQRSHAVSSRLHHSRPLLQPVPVRANSQPRPPTLSDINVVTHPGVLGVRDDQSIHGGIRWDRPHASCRNEVQLDPTALAGRDTSLEEIVCQSAAQALPLIEIYVEYSQTCSQATSSRRDELSV